MSDTPTREWLEARHPHTVHQLLGVHVDSYEPEVVVSLPVHPGLFQPMGVVHGGIYVLLAESAASIAANVKVGEQGMMGMGMEINANHLRPVSQGVLRATASCLHEGKTSHVYQIEVRDDEQRLISVCRCTIAIRPKPKT